MFKNLQQMQHHDVGKVVSKDALLTRLETIVSNKGFVISDNEGLGNCMFYALCEQLHLVKGITISPEKLRQSIVQYLRRNSKLVSEVFIQHLNWTFNFIRWQKSLYPVFVMKLEWEYKFLYSSSPLGIYCLWLCYSYLLWHVTMVINGFWSVVEIFIYFHSSMALHVDNALYSSAIKLF